MTRLKLYLMTGFMLAGVISLAVLGVRWYGAHQYAAGHAAAIDERAQADFAAVLRRADENTALAERQGAINTTITKEKDDEIADLRARLAAAPRLRVGAAICSDRSSGPAETKGPAGSDRPDPPAGLVSAAADRDFRQLIADVETDLATGRACQAFLRENGLVP